MCIINFFVVGNSDRDALALQVSANVTDFCQDNKTHLKSASQDFVTLKAGLLKKLLLPSKKPLELSVILYCFVDI